MSVNTTLYTVIILTLWIFNEPCSIEEPPLLPVIIYKGL